MTKYEWESELKKNIHRLPADEIKRVLDYYDELFEDNIERGKSEREIIREFGNPSDVADKIMSEYEGELRSDDYFDEPPKKSSAKVRDFEEASGETVFDGHADNKKADGGATTVIEKRDGEGVNGRAVKLMIFIVVNIVTGFAPMFIMLAAWIVLAAITVAGVALVVGGAAAFFVSFGPAFGGAFGSGVAQIGISLALIGIGLALTLAFTYLLKQYAKLTARGVKYLFAKE